jgi:hypothetical protein
VIVDESFLVKCGAVFAFYIWTLAFLISLKKRRAAYQFSTSAFE